MKEYFDSVRTVLVAVEAHLEAKEYQQAKDLLNSGLDKLFTAIYAGISKALQEQAIAADSAQRAAQELSQETDKYVDQMVEECLSGGQNAEQAAARIHNKCGMEMTEAQSLVNGRLGGKIARNELDTGKLAQRSQAEINAENMATAERETKMAALVESCAKAAYAANADYCESIKDPVLPWEVTADSIRNGVRYLMANPNVTPEQQHANWMAEKIADGWVYGEVKDAEAKTHPCLVAWADLPLAQQRKDEIFREAVHAEMEKQTGASEAKMGEGAGSAMQQQVQDA